MLCNQIEGKCLIMRRQKNIFWGFLFIFLNLIFFSGCSTKQSETKEVGSSVAEVEPAEQTQATENISITTSDKYNITLDKEFYRPSMRIAKSRDEYISIQQLKNGNEKLSLSDPKSYTKDDLKEDFQNYISTLTGFSPITEVTCGSKEMLKTSTSVNAIKSDIYRYLSEGKNVYKIVVAGPEFKESDEAEKIIESLVLQ